MSARPECPPIDELMRSDVSSETLEHARECEACGSVVGLVASTRSVDPEACEEQEVALSELVAGEVSGARAEALQRHLQACEGCNRAALRLMLSQRELDDIPEPVLEGGDASSAGVAAARADTLDGTRETKWRKPMAEAVKEDPRRMLRTVAQMGAVAAAASVITYFVAAGGAGERADAGERERAAAGERAGAGVRADDALAEALARAKAAEASAERAEARLEAIEKRLDDEEAAADRPDRERVRDPLARRDDAPRRADDTALRDPWSRSPADSGAKTGKLSIACRPMCDQVTIDGTSVGPSPVVGQRLAPGRHTVVGRYQGRTKSAAVVIEAGTTRRMTFSMADSRDRGF